MKVIITVLIGLLFNSVSAQDIREYKWKFNGDIRNYKIISSQTKSLDILPIPFDTSLNIPLAAINILINHSALYDSEMTAYASGLARQPQPNLVVLSNEKILLYKNKKQVVVKNKKYLIYCFSIGKSNDFTEHNCFDVYYISGIGFVLCVDHILDDPNRNWNRYQLSNVINIKGKPIVTSEILIKLEDSAVDFMHNQE
jgi:hypothetical protein